MKDILIGGLDIGTSGCKIVLYDARGQFVRDEYTEYDVTRKGGLHEIDACAVFAAVKKVIKAADCKNTAAIAATSFGETFACLIKMMSRARRQCFIPTRAEKSSAGG